MATNYTDFYDAQSARQIAVGQRGGSNDILTEVNILQMAIDQAAASGEVEVSYHFNTTLVFDTVTITGSPMTVDTANVYYNAWAQPDVYQSSQYLVAQEKMNQVIGYFTRLGYSIKRYRDTTLNQFLWTIKY